MLPAEDFNGFNTFFGGNVQPITQLKARFAFILQRAPGNYLLNHLLTFPSGLNRQMNKLTKPKARYKGKATVNKIIHNRFRLGGINTTMSFLNTRHTPPDNPSAPRVNNEVITDRALIPTTPTKTPFSPVHPRMRWYLLLVSEDGCNYQRRL